MKNLTSQDSAVLKVILIDKYNDISHQIWESKKKGKSLELLEGLNNQLRVLTLSIKELL